jgi:chemotaxis protein MotA
MAQQTGGIELGRRRLDYLAFLGLAVGIGGIIAGLLLEGGRIADVAQITAAVIVFGGTLGAVLLTTPRAMVKSAVRRLRQLASEEQIDPADIIELVVVLATKARKNGIVALETEINQIRYAFLHKGLMLAVDGTAIATIRDMLELEIRLGLQEADTDAKVLEAAGGYAPTIGIIGAVIGLIQVMKHLDNLSQVGAGIAVAFVATIYGVGSANLLFLPLGQKIRLRAHQAMRVQQLMLEGIMSIGEGINPRLIRRKLDAFLPNRGTLREAGGPRLEAATSRAVPA